MAVEVQTEITLGRGGERPEWVREKSIDSLSSITVKLVISLDASPFTKQLALKTDSIAKMDKLKLLQLKHVELSGSYENFPEIRWLCWHRSCLKTIPSGLLMSSLVAIDMTNGNLEEFEPPVVLNLLKILILKDCENLVLVRNLHQLPNLETLILWNCWNLTHVCESIGSLASLHVLDLTGCSKLCEALSIQNELESREALCIDGGIPQHTFSLPDSLSSLFLYDCNLAHDNDFPVDFNGRPILYMNLGSNQFEYFPSNVVDIQTLRVLDLTCCLRLKSLLWLPSTLEELYVYSCPLLEEITFQSARFKLREFGYIGCDNLSHIQGLFSLVSLKKIHEAELDQHMKWIKDCCQDDTVELVGDEITKGGLQHIQILYEFGIKSTYLPGKYESLTMSEYMSSSSFLSFRMPSGPSNRKTTGLNVTSLYRSSGEYEDQDTVVLFAKVSNRTKGLTWIYNPVVYCKPRVNENAVWLSYWPIGNVLDTGDEVNVDIIVGNGLIVSGCGATLVDSEIWQENCQYITEEEEVIGGDLSEFELTNGAFYLCRRDFFKSMTPDWLKMLVGDTVHYKELKGWRKSRQSQHSKVPYSELKTFRAFDHKKVVLRIDLDDPNNYDKIKRKVMRTVSSLRGVREIKWNSINERIATLTVLGDVDAMDVYMKTKKIACTKLVTAWWSCKNVGLN
ncbi:TMV resistance protein N-like protein [Tanacetum coccineum]